MKTKSILFIVLCFLFLQACSGGNSRDKAQVFYDEKDILKFEELSIIDFDQSGAFEFWILNNGRGADFRWAYNKSSKKFVLDDANKTNCLAYLQVDDPNPYFKKLQSRVKKYGIKKISQSPWPGNYVKFFFSPSAGLIYKSSGFSYDSPQVKEYEMLFQKGEELDVEWKFFKQ